MAVVRVLIVSVEPSCIERAFAVSRFKKEPGKPNETGEDNENPKERKHNSRS
jgi:hypothetical protein